MWWAVVALCFRPVRPSVRACVRVGRRRQCPTGLPANSAAHTVFILFLHFPYFAENIIRERSFSFLLSFCAIISISRGQTMMCRYSLKPRTACAECQDAAYCCRCSVVCVPAVGVCLSVRLSVRHGTGSLGYRVNGSFGSSFTSGSPCHHFDPVWDPSFCGFRKNAQNAKRTFEMLKWQKSLSGVCCWTEITGCRSMQWTFTFTYDYYKFFGLRILLHT